MTPEIFLVQSEEWHGIWGPLGRSGDSRKNLVI